MVTPVTRFNIQPFWDESYLHLDYAKEPFNNSDAVVRWLELGFPDNFVGAMCDMRKSQPLWNSQIITEFTQRGWMNVCTSYYRM